MPLTPQPELADHLTTVRRDSLCTAPPRPMFCYCSFNGPQWISMGACSVEYSSATPPKQQLFLRKLSNHHEVQSHIEMSHCHIVTLKNVLYISSFQVCFYCIFSCQRQLFLLLLPGSMMPLTSFSCQLSGCLHFHVNSGLPSLSGSHQTLVLHWKTSYTIHILHFYEPKAWTKFFLCFFYEPKEASVPTSNTNGKFCSDEKCETTARYNSSWRIKNKGQTN